MAEQSKYAKRRPRPTENYPEGGTDGDGKISADPNVKLREPYDNDCYGTLSRLLRH